MCLGFLVSGVLLAHCPRQRPPPNFEVQWYMEEAGPAVREVVGYRSVSKECSSCYVS